jgi:hypothetical protein
MTTTPTTPTTPEATQAALEALMRDLGYTNLTLTVEEALQQVKDIFNAEDIKSNHMFDCLRLAKEAAETAEAWLLGYRIEESWGRGDMEIGYALRNLQYAIRRRSDANMALLGRPPVQGPQ